MRKLPPLNAIRAFEATARLGNVQKASEELFVTHGAVSRQIKQLESWLGVTLFDRSKRSVKLNPEGKIYLRSASASLDLLHEASQNIKHIKSKNTLGIGTTHSLANKWLMDKLPDFYKSHPGLEVWLLLDQKLADFENSDVDISIRMGKGPWPGLNCIPFMQDRLLPVCSPKLLESGDGISRIEDLKHYTLLHDQDPYCQWQLWLETNGFQLANASKGPRYTSGDILINSAIDGQGVALVSELLASKDIAEKKLVQVLPQTVELGDYFWLVMTNENTQSAAVNDFYKWILKQSLQA